MKILKYECLPSQEFPINNLYKKSIIASLYNNCNNTSWSWRPRTICLTRFDENLINQITKEFVSIEIIKKIRIYSDRIDEIDELFAMLKFIRKNKKNQIKWNLFKS